MTNPAEIFLATMHSGGAKASLDTGLLAASSMDGVNFRNLCGSVGTYYMAFNDVKCSVYYLRTSSNLVSGWSAPRQLDLDRMMHRGDSLNLVFLSDGALRFYISNGNRKKYVQWCVDSPDLGVTWTSPAVLRYEGFSPRGSIGPR